MSYKKIVAWLLTISLLFGITACQKENPKTDIKKDSVVISIGSEPETLDPTQGWGHGNSPIVQSTLVKYNADNDTIRIPLKAI